MNFIIGLSLGWKSVEISTEVESIPIVHSFDGDSWEKEESKWKLKLG